MLDLRKEKILDLSSETCLRGEITYLFEDPLINKKLIAKFIGYFNDENDEGLLIEFKKMALLSAEPEIATVYFLASGDFGKGNKSCYVMDFVDGNTLQKILNDNNHLSLGFVSDFLSQLASGMGKAHHYEISHGDLHEENIMVNSLGYVKIIDFLWWDHKRTFEHNSQEDIKSFKLITEALTHKLTEADNALFQLQSQYIKNISSFKNVAKNISILDRISLEISLIDDDSKMILSKIISLMKPEANLMYVLENKSVPIPEQYIPELTEQQKERIERGKKSRFNLNIFDSRGAAIQKNLNRVFNLKLHQLRQAGFINWQMGVENTGENLIGPYVLNFQIFFTVKLFEWRRLNLEFNFLRDFKDRTLVDLILQ